MMVQCMNDKNMPDPVHAGQTITDPLFNPLYSQFCYELPYMPGATTYLDTPVVPTAAFVGAGYNNPDCAYPAATPAIASVIGDVAGPWVSAAGSSLTINSLPDQQVTNYGYSGPSATAAPFNAKTVNRHYGFGTAGTVTIGGVNATVTNWMDTQITVTVPSGVPNCSVQQQAQYGGSTAQCGELVITTAAGKQSIDAVTVTIGGKAPTVLTAGQTIQSAIDAAAPGDLIIAPPGTYRELVLMWKPVRLQGVGAASSIIDASPHPAGKLDPWRRTVNCLFGLAINGQPNTNTNPFDNPGDTANGGAPYTCPTGGSGPGPDGNNWMYFSGGPNFPTMAVDRIPLEGILGWDASVNGNLAEQLQEPSIMGAYEGAGITVLAKGVNIPAGATDVFGAGAEATFPTGTLLLTTADCATGPNGSNQYPSNFQCNPSAIDGLGITDSSQGGGGIFVHAWGHNLQIANNRVFNNAGTLSGGMSIGQGESPEAYLNGTANDTDPGSCLTPAPGQTLNAQYPLNTQLPYCLNTNVNIHNNAITNNSSTGDELFTGTPAGAGGASICTGADYYNFNYNWVCGNLSTGDGGGVGHLGFTWNGDIEHNTFLFNQSTNPSIQSNGGGLIIMGAAPDNTILVNGAATECGSVTDSDCIPGLSDGTGPGLKINANLFVGNSADAGSGGALRFQAVNGTDIARFPKNPENWYSVQVTNNIITNNIAGWDGAGISLEDALVVNVLNNTIASNDTTASSGVLFNTLGAPLASSQSPKPTCLVQGTTASCPQVAGLVTMRNSPQLTSSFTGISITCPAGHYSGSTATNGSCTQVSYPLLYNDVFWQNRSFDVGVGSRGPGQQNQQNVVTLHNAITNSLVASQPQADAVTANGGGQIITGGTGACVTGTTYWDIGVRGDTRASNHSSGFTLAPTFSVLTDASDYSGRNNLGSNPFFMSQYCNGSRVPPENGGLGYQVPPGIADAVVPNPVFTLTPAATVDEGNNWINISWGPLSLNNPVTGTQLGNYALAPFSTAIDYVPTAGEGLPAGFSVPATDFFGNPRPDPVNTTSFDVGAVEYQHNRSVAGPPTLTSVTPNVGERGQTVAVTLTGTNLTSTSAVTVSGTGVTVTNVVVVNDTTVTANFVVASNASLGADFVTVTTAGGTTAPPLQFTVSGPSLTSISPNSGARGRSVPVTLTGVDFSGATNVTVSGSGVTVSGFTVVNDTTITATFAISNSAGLTARNVAVATPNATGGVTNSVTFTITGPTLTSVNPSSGLRGQTVNVTLTGADFTGATAVSAGTGIVVSNVVVVSDTTITATFAVATGTGAPLGGHTVTVSTPGGSATRANGFTVTGPLLTSISPTSGLAGRSVPVTITGVGLTGTTSVTVSGTGVTANSITVVNDNTVTATFVIAPTAGATARNVSVTNSFGGVSNTLTGAFTVSRPTLTSISPTSGSRTGAQPVAVTLTGTHLTGTTAISVSGTGITVSGLTVVSDTQVTANFTIVSTAALTARTVSVTAAGATSNTETFTVTP
jgi:hypothetical protein